MTDGVASDSLVGARVQRVDTPREDVLAITLYQGGTRGALLIQVDEGRARVGWTSERPRGAPASAFGLRLRRALLGARVQAVTPEGIAFRRGEDRLVLEIRERPAGIAFFGTGPVGWLGSAGGTPVAIPSTRADLETAGAAIVQALEGGDLEARRRALTRAAQRRRRSLQRRRAKIEADLGRETEIETLRHRGTLLLSHLSTIDADADEAWLTDWASEPPREIRIPIDRRLGARGQADALFKRARKLDRARAIAAERLENTDLAIARLDESARAVADADPDGLEREASRLEALGATVPRSGKGRRASSPTRLPYHRFESADGGVILVGRSARDNETLTLEHARPWDLWLHARDYPGSHVVVVLDKGQSCPPERLLDAAHLAVRYSSAPSADQERLEVTYTERRYVRKAGRAGPGAVTLDRERVLLLRVEEDRLERLLRGAPLTD